MAIVARGQITITDLTDSVNVYYQDTEPGGTETRTNLVWHFGTEAGTGGTVVTTTGLTDDNAPWQQVDWTSTPSGGNRRLTLSGASWILDPLPAGKTYSASANLASNLASGMGLMIEYHAVFGGTTNYYSLTGPIVTGTTPTLATCTMTVPSVAPNGGTPEGLAVYAAPQAQSEVASGKYIYADSPLVEEAPEPGPWFDGNTVNPDSYGRWTSTPDASISKLCEHNFMNNDIWFDTGQTPNQTYIWQNPHWIKLETGTEYIPGLNEVAKNIQSWFDFVSDDTDAWLQIGHSEHDVQMRLTQGALQFYNMASGSMVLIAEFDGETNHLRIDKAEVNELIFMSLTEPGVIASRWVQEPSGGISLI